MRSVAQRRLAAEGARTARGAKEGWKRESRRPLTEPAARSPDASQSPRQGSSTRSASPRRHRLPTKATRRAPAQLQPFGRSTFNSSSRCHCQVSLHGPFITCPCFWEGPVESEGPRSLRARFTRRPFLRSARSAPSSFYLCKPAAKLFLAPTSRHPGNFVQHEAFRWRDNAAIRRASSIVAPGSLETIGAASCVNTMAARALLASWRT